MQRFSKASGVFLATCIQSLEMLRVLLSRTEKHFTITLTDTQSDTPRATALIAAETHAGCHATQADPVQYSNVPVPLTQLELEISGEAGRNRQKRRARCPT